MKATRVHADEPCDIGDRSQLFVGQTLVQEAHNVDFVLHPGKKHAHNPLILPDQPWEGWRLALHGEVMYDAQEKLYKVWYLADSGDNRTWFNDRYMMCYAVSRDGIRWDKPTIRAIEANNGRPNGGLGHYETPTVIKDMRDPDPQRRYKMIAYHPQKRGYHTFTSPDGLHWTPLSATPIAPGGDVIDAFYDQRSEQYVAYAKIGHKVRGVRRRVFWRITSNDFTNWSQPQLSFLPGQEDDVMAPRRIALYRDVLDRPDNPAIMRADFYGIGFHLAESTTLAFPCVFYINNGARFGNEEGPGEIQLASSRDGLHWARFLRHPVIEPGSLGEWDRGWFWTASRTLEVGDEVRLYYAAGNYTHGTPALYRERLPETEEPTGRTSRFTSGIGLATWQRDRFVSVDGAASGGTLETVPVVFKGDHLEVNADIHQDGGIFVELLDEDGQPIDGFARSETLTGDNLRHIMRFTDGSGVSPLAGSQIRLRFHLTNASLYAFAFRADDKSADDANNTQTANEEVKITDEHGLRKTVLLPPGPGNPRNSEGDFIQLKNGRILFVYTHFTSGAGDHAKAFLASRYSDDGGLTWSEHDETALPNEGDWNIMSVSLLRLQDGRIALFYARKNSLEDCRPLMRISKDEGKTWSEPTTIIPDDEMGYYVLNNDRVVQLASGRLVAPVALHNQPGWDKPQWEGHIMCYISDDNGQTWRRSKTSQMGFSPDDKRINVQEPGVIALKDGRLMIFCRTNAGSQYTAFSNDDGDTWSKLAPSNIISPQSPATIERIPKTGDLLMVWNDHTNIPDELKGKRTPLTVAISRDDGQTWENKHTIDGNPNGWYCYTAMDIIGDQVLLGHCAGDRRTGGLNTTQITVFNLDWLYSPNHLEPNQ